MDYIDNITDDMMFRANVALRRQDMDMFEEVGITIKPDNISYSHDVIWMQILGMNKFIQFGDNSMSAFSKVISALMSRCGGAVFCFAAIGSSDGVRFFVGTNSINQKKLLAILQANIPGFTWASNADTQTPLNIWTVKSSPN